MESLRFLFTLSLQAKPEFSLPVCSVTYTEGTILAVSVLFTPFCYFKESFWQGFSRKIREIMSKTITINKTWNLQNRVCDAHLTWIPHRPWMKSQDHKASKSIPKGLVITWKRRMINCWKITIVPPCKVFVCTISTVWNFKQSNFTRPNHMSFGS